MKKNQIQYKPFKNRNMQKLTFRNQKIQLGNKKIVVYVPKWKSYFTKSAKTGYNYAIYDFEQLIIGLENLFNISLRIKGNLCFKVSRQHHALIQNELAKQYNRENKKLDVRDNKGKGWLIIDNSDFNNAKQNELECIDNQNSVKDTDNVISPFFNNLRSGNWDINRQLKVNQGIMENQLIFAENMSSHIKAIQDLSKGVNELRKEVKNLRK